MIDSSEVSECPRKFHSVICNEPYENGCWNLFRWKFICNGRCLA